MSARGYASKHSLLPRGYISRAGADGIDTIGLSVSSYALLDQYWQSFFFTDPLTPKVGVTVADVIADPNTNTQGGNVFYSATRNILVVYAPSLTEAAERRLWKSLSGTQFDQTYIDGVLLSVDNYPVYIGV